MVRVVMEIEVGWFRLSRRLPYGCVVPAHPMTTRTEHILVIAAMGNRAEARQEERFERKVHMYVTSCTVFTFTKFLSKASWISLYR